ncbi:MAG: hypothetical protein RL023_267 [Candidatus Parcubacteria bacterium]|jgi:hypothetical protein
MKILMEYYENMKAGTPKSKAKAQKAYIKMWNSPKSDRILLKAVEKAAATELM